MKNLIIILCLCLFWVGCESITESEESKFVGVWELLDNHTSYKYYTMVLKPDKTGHIIRRFHGDPILQNGKNLKWDIVEDIFIINYQPSTFNSSTIFEYRFDESHLILERYDNLYDDMKFIRKKDKLTPFP